MPDGQRDLERAHELLSLGERSLRRLVDGPGVVLLDESTWGHVVGEEVFCDVDSPEDLRRLGLEALLDNASPLE